MGRLGQEMDATDRHVGSGWISGMVSIVLATIGLATTLCLLYPQFLTVVDIRGYYNVGWVRIALHVVLVLAFVSSAVSVALRRTRWLGFAGMSLVLIATLMGFGEPALYAYIFVVYLVSTFVHSNIRFHFGFLQHIMATPRFHHWHHGIDDEAMDINYAVHFPFIDRIFGTYHMPEDRWPEDYGVQNHPVPSGYLRQFLYPFRRK